MKIVIIGSGNTATVLGRKLNNAGHHILQVCGRNLDAASQLANIIGASAITSFETIRPDADIYIIALSDAAIPEIGKVLQFTNQLLVHTAGSVSIDVLENCSENYGVLYPFQTLRKEIEPMPEIPFFIDANNEESKQLLIQLASSISSRVQVVGDMARQQYHLCAVMVNNFSNFLYMLSEQYCNNHGLDFKNLLPLIEETAHRLQRFSPFEVQTGPAIRNDRDTIQKHLDLLEDTPRLKDIYALLSDHIVQFDWKKG
jgi:predicted short-subunit dehydrogenase-like oxidoreductase (DUF2520 family)